MITGERLASQAVQGGYIGIPYSQLDCQGFVEKVLADCGVRKPDGSIYNWRGSNSMYRNFYQWRGSIDECKKAFSILPQGCFVFKMRDDDGERQHGYNDGLGNFYHVGIYIGDKDRAVIHSTTGGVQYAKTLSGWNYVTLPSMIDYTAQNIENIGVQSKMIFMIEEIKKLCKDMEDLIK